MKAYPALRLIVDDLAVARGIRIIFESLSFTLQNGAALVLTGPNGIGKTTLLRTLAGFLQPASGVIAVESDNSADQSLGEQCHYVGHLNGVKPGLSVAENLAFFAEFLGGNSHDSTLASEILALSSLIDVPAGYLSAGQKRRLGLARLLCARRPVWLLDEPAVSLDTRSTEILASMVVKHLADGGIVISATHTPLGWTTATNLNLGDHVAATQAEAY